MNLELVERIVALAGSYPVSEITVEQEGQRVSVRKPLHAALAVSAAAVSAEPAAQETNSAGESAPAPGGVDESRLLAAPMVGIFHHNDPPIRYGATLASGQVVGSIESMKLMNDVTAEEAGQVSEVLIEDGVPVEYGQALFRLSSV